MSKEDGVIFTQILQLFNGDSLNSYEIQLICQLSKATNDLNKESEKLRKEGHILTVDDNRLKGIKRKIINPRKHSVTMCTRQVAILRRTLGLHASAEPISTLRKRRLKEAEIKEDFRDIMRDDLIPTLQ
jgi:hypothetical protein